ncbi:aminomethyl-transferring glycine dehydrogenase [Pseudobdellovibrio exovorus]|uniref:Glycine dehydrogenase (decarboxylating) n=1 Tax=Pseudobdellovibrio exovorus JSS TaxID=1184267 RepID=M4VP27_9BACT|nr:aminomethyl-transferring glycine dehydrogenase [Pseudobdellovibrio exovorus]AGH94884.1 glycine dehydrogenase [Pseudobdellovibrio exovorus JSS]
MSTTLSQLSTQNEFTGRHIGPSDQDQKTMLQALGFSNTDELISKVVPKTILTKDKMDIGNGISEYDILAELKSIMGKNKIYTSLIGMGFHDTITPSVIARNVFENPVWYTAYTPYQPEISQGRLQSLLNFQTMISDLTGMEIANASLLDEGTAVAEAVAMAFSLSKKQGVKTFVVHPDAHPHVIEVLKTRSEPQGLEMILQDPATYDYSKEIFAAVFQYPTSSGRVEDYRSTSQKLHDHGAFVIASADLLSLTLLTPPGEWGADIVVGNSQRFGVPLGYGGPHAAFLATKDSFKRSLPGRLVGVSVDNHGHQALRLTLQTREQHIRRDKATSNICTAQVLLANMAAMYAVYHGPQGLKNIAQRVHRLTQLAAEGLKKIGLTAETTQFFDTLKVKVASDKLSAIKAASEKHEVNLRYFTDAVGFSFNETNTVKTVEAVLTILNGGQALGFKVEDLEKTLTTNIPSELTRQSAYLTHPNFNSYHSETELMRYIYSLQNKDITLTHSMIPLGSCTMKLNAATELAPISWPEVNKLHPFVPIEQAQGYRHLIQDLERKLCAITGFAAVSLQPNSGAQGEYAGLLVIREYFKKTNQSHRNICLIPSSAHGTNPASAVMVGFKVVVVNCDENGNVDVADLKAKAEQHKDSLAALMVTYPSTHGVFEEAIIDICETIHKNGGQVYMDGANLNAMVGLARPGVFGPDVSHMNLHKTFAIPHGGGGPGVGPIGVAKHLAPYLPTHSLIKDAGPETGVSSTTSAPWGSASILPISWSYITMMGDSGLRAATTTSILNANYIAKRLEPHYPIVYKGKEGLVAHECIIDIRPLKKSHDIDVTDIAKRLIDYGFHAPTMSWPVAGTLMIEPTESESKAELDRFCDAMIEIRKEADTTPDVIRQSPHTAESLMATEWTQSYSREKAAYPLKWVKSNKYWPPVGRVDNAFGDRNIICSCPPLDEYQ